MITLPLKAILAPLFLFVFAPLGMILRVLGVDLINKNPDNASETYWQIVNAEKSAKSCLNRDEPG